jgi:hypothetical protein
VTLQLAQCLHHGPTSKPARFPGMPPSCFQKLDKVFGRVHPHDEGLSEYAYSYLASTYRDTLYHILLPPLRFSSSILPTNSILTCLSCLPPMARYFTQPALPLESHQPHQADSGWRRCDTWKSRPINGTEQSSRLFKNKSRLTSTISAISALQ